MQLLPLSTPAQNAAAALCHQLNACLSVFPGTSLRLKYEILSAIGRGPTPNAPGATATLCWETLVGGKATAQLSRQNWVGHDGR